MVSPNGKWVVIAAVGEDGVTRMYLRALDSVEMRPLAGTESGNALPPPVFWSPDSRFIAFSFTNGPFTSGQLKKLDISGGPPTTVCDIPAAVPGGTWNNDGVIVFAANNAQGLMRVSAAGGMATPVTSLDRARGETNHRYPRFLPDGKHFLYQRISNIPENRGIFVGSIDAKPEEQRLEPVMLSDRQAIYTEPLGRGPGRLLFLRDTTLLAQPFDPASFELSGEPVPVADQVASFAPATVGLFSVSDTGVLAYRVGVGGSQLQLTWFDAEGKVLGTAGEKGAYQVLVLETLRLGQPGRRPGSARPPGVPRRGHWQWAVDRWTKVHLATLRSDPSVERTRRGVEEVRYGHPIDRSRGGAPARWWGLGILPLA
jgi:hypothetical protein